MNEGGNLGGNAAEEGQGAVRRQYKPMPARKSKEAPEFDETEPESLQRYFEDLEACFDNAGVQTDAEKKRYVGKICKGASRIRVEYFRSRRGNRLLH